MPLKMFLISLVALISTSALADALSDEMKIKGKTYESDGEAEVYIAHDLMVAPKGSLFYVRSPGGDSYWAMSGTLQTPDGKCYEAVIWNYEILKFSKIISENESQKLICLDNLNPTS